MNDASIQITIKETLECMNALEAMAFLLGQINKDNVVDMNDVPLLLIELSSKMAIYTEAFKGSSEIPKEIKDLDLEESKVLIEKLFSILTAFQKGKIGIV